MKKIISFSLNNLSRLAKKLRDNKKALVFFLVFVAFLILMVVSFVLPDKSVVLQLVSIVGAILSGVIVKRLSQVDTNQVDTNEDLLLLNMLDVLMEHGGEVEEDQWKKEVRQRVMDISDQNFDQAFQAAILANGQYWRNLVDGVWDVTSTGKAYKSEKSSLLVARRKVKK